MLYFGGGISYTHQDNIVIRRVYYNDIVEQSGTGSFRGSYYVIGVGYPIKIWNSISIPIGLYWHRFRDYKYWVYNRGIHSEPRDGVSLQLGIIYSFE